MGMRRPAVAVGMAMDFLELRVHDIFIIKTKSMGVRHTHGSSV